MFMYKPLYKKKIKTYICYGLLRTVTNDSFVTIIQTVTKKK